MGDKDITIATFASVTGSDPGTARFYLEMNGWNLERATESFYDQGGVAVDPSLLDTSNLGSSGGGAGGKLMHVDLEVPIKGRADEVGQHLQAGFGLLYKNQMFSDVVLNVNGIEKYPVHKIVLCAWSDVFRALINGFSVAGSVKSGDAMDTKEKEGEDIPELQIDLEERLMSYFPLMLEYMYTGATKVSLTDVVYMIELASKFSVLALKDGCSDILFANSKEINYLLDIATKYGCSKLENQCANHIATHFENYQKSGEIMNLSASTWEELLKSDDIEAYEEDIYVAMMIYVQKFNPPESYEVLERLLPWVRFPLMNDRFLEEQVAKNQLLQMIPITHELLHEAYRFKLHKSERTSTHRCKPRRPTLRWSKKDISTGLRLSDDQMTVTFPSSGGYLNNQWLSVVTETYITTGVHRFEFKINHCASNWLFVGVAGKNWKGWNDTASGYLGYGPHSWAYGCASGWGKASNMQHQNYGTPYKSGDVIRCTVDMDNKTIAFALNGKSFGTAFSNLESAVRPAVTLYQQSDSITLRRVFD